MRVTILGSSGQIGAYLTTYLRDKGHQVKEFDKNNLPAQDLTKIPNLQLRDAIYDSDFVFFLAFDVGGSHYLKKYQHTFGFLDNNTRMMANVFGYLQEFKKPFVFASSQMSNMSYSPYGVMKRVGELYTKSLKGLIVKFWNVYGVENDMEKAHVITDFIAKGFETGTIDMMTNGSEHREFLYAEDCCEALETVMQEYSTFTSDDDLHITSGVSTSILEIARNIQSLFKEIGREVTVVPNESRDEVQKDARNVSNPYIKRWWRPQTSIQEGIKKVFEEMKNAHV
jgi:nucleoside-diphosphate-sugar epimerase